MIWEIWRLIDCDHVWDAMYMTNNLWEAVAQKAIWEKHSTHLFVIVGRF